MLSPLTPLHTQTRFSGRHRARRNPRPFVKPETECPSSVRGSWLGRNVDTYIRLAHIQRTLPKGSPCIVLGAMPEQLATIVATRVLTQTSGKAPKRRERRSLLEAWRTHSPIFAINLIQDWFDGTFKSRRDAPKELLSLLKSESSPLPQNTFWQRFSPALRASVGRIMTGNALNWRSLLKSKLLPDKPVTVIANNFLHEAIGDHDDRTTDNRIGAFLDSLNGLPAGSCISLGNQEFLPGLAIPDLLLKRGLKPIPITLSDFGKIERMAAQNPLIPENPPYIFQV